MTQTKDYYMPKPLASKLSKSEAEKLFNSVKGNKSALDKLSTFVRNTYRNNDYYNYQYVELIVSAINSNDRILNNLRDYNRNGNNQYHNVEQEDYLTAFKATYKEYINVCEQYGFKINLNIVGLSRLRRELHVLKEHGAMQLI